MTAPNPTGPVKSSGKPTHGHEHERMCRLPWIPPLRLWQPTLSAHARRLDLDRRLELRNRVVAKRYASAPRWHSSNRKIPCAWSWKFDWVFSQPLIPNSFPIRFLCAQVISHRSVRIGPSASSGQICDSFQVRYLQFFWNAAHSGRLKISQYISFQKEIA